jgi:hypothetical protein
MKGFMGTDKLTCMLKLNTHFPYHCGKQVGNKTDNSEKLLSVPYRYTQV